MGEEEEEEDDDDDDVDDDVDDDDIDDDVDDDDSPGAGSLDLLWSFFGLGSRDPELDHGCPVPKELHP